MSDTSNSDPFQPPVDPPEIRLLEHADFVGVTISEIMYGFTIILFFRCMRGLLWPRKHSGFPRNPSMALYTFVLFSLGTVFVAMNARNSELAYIDYRGFPGGPLAFTFSRYSTAIVVIPNAAFILANWLADGFLLFRCKVIWGDKYWVLILPVLMFLGSIAMGILTIFQSSRPNASLWSAVTVDFALPYFSLSASLNILFLPLLMSFRLHLHHRMTRKKGLGSAIPYASVGILVESSALYAVSSLLFIATYGANNGASALFLPILSQTQIIAPLLIISRVANQRAYGSSQFHGGAVVSSSQPRTLVDTIPDTLEGNANREKVQASHV
ncbi:hypothetical protein D9615_003080 [Tricholomella constricta]|uniref:Uncharacterized protein n=1 Tax=Tricholomella constricta TaxID=117010 RepID=A0A8H5HG12_9AGAR|nr:hypothetical protein D9615_003080 [Tricholomella constricta]